MSETEQTDRCQPYGLTREEAERLFNDTRATQEWLSQRRWQGDRPIKCSACESTDLQEHPDNTNITFRCNACNHRESTVTGTPMDRSRTGLETWLLISHRVLSAEPGREPEYSSQARKTGVGLRTAKRIVQESLRAKKEGKDLLTIEAREEDTSQEEGPEEKDNTPDEGEISLNAMEKCLSQMRDEAGRLRKEIAAREEEIAEIQENIRVVEAGVRVVNLWRGEREGTDRDRGRPDAQNGRNSDPTGAGRPGPRDSDIEPEEP